MPNKVKIITAPDMLFDQAESILVICPDEDLKTHLQTYLEKIDRDVNLYYYDGADTDIKWLLTVAKMVDIVLIDVDNATEEVTHFLSYIISIPTTYYKCVHKQVPWDLLNQNRFYDFPNLNED